MKKYLITGGTGSLGRGLLRRITDADEIRVMARSEATILPLMDKYPQHKFIFGDVRDYSECRDAVRGVDVVIHAAAFKFLNLAETQARQCVMTNVVGSLNIIEAVKEEKTVDVCLGISTDKVAYARNVYGCTKHIMEKLFREADTQSDTRFLCVRYGNVLGTTGSVIPIWEKQLEEGKPITLTHKDMRRFFFTVDESVDLIFQALEKGEGGEVFTTMMQSYSLYDMAKGMSDDVVITGLRPGEKINETLIADYEGTEFTTEDTGNGELVVI